MDTSKRQRDVSVRTFRRGEAISDDLRGTTPAERVGMMWQLALNAWAFMGGGDVEPRLPRHVVRVLRRRG